MESRYRRHITREQKKLLVKLIKSNPRELITGTITRDFSLQDLQRLWKQIAVQCNALPGGAEKTWKQWRKCWQDLRHRHMYRDKKTKTKKAIKILSADEKEKLLKKIAEDDPDDMEPEFAEFQGETDQQDEAVESDFMFEVDATGSCSDQDMLPETKVFDQPLINLKKSNKKYSKKSRRDSHSCEFNCETLASQEERKVQIKEDYYNFKKDYLTKKLKYMKEQSEALQAIARHLNDKSTDTLRLNGENM